MTNDKEVPKAKETRQARLEGCMASAILGWQ